MHRHCRLACQDVRDGCFSCVWLPPRAQEMREVNKGIGVELMHHLNDGLWKTTSLA
jgi:hypothetical protein